MNGRFLAGAGSVLSAVVSSACCWLPLALMGVGLSAVSVASFFERSRTLFLVIAALLLGVGFYLNYFRKERCRPDELCSHPNPKFLRFNRGMLWISTGLVLAFALFPSHVGLLFGLPTTTKQQTTAATETWTLGIEGMSCAGCEVALKTALSNVPGVLETHASYDDGTATVAIDPASPPSRMALSSAIAKTGYRLSVIHNGEDPLLRLSGQWIADTTTEDGQRVEIVVDLGQVDSRWVGEFDLPAIDVQDYPVEVAVPDSSVVLHFTAIAIDFRGVLSDDGAWLRGRAIQRGGEEDWQLDFERTAEVPSFSELFLELEAAASDSSAVQPLSDNATELRAAFNRDRDRVRLLLLLAPS